MKISIEKILDALLKVHHFIKKLRIRQRIKHFFLIPKGTPLYKRILLRIVHVIIIIFIGLGMVDSNILWLFGRSPSIRSINDPDQKITSELYSADGKLIGKYFDENRSPLKYEEIPENIIKSLIATEDTRFYQHHAID